MLRQLEAIKAEGHAVCAGLTESPVLPEFMAVRDQLADRVRRSDGLDLKRVRVVSPVTRLLRLPLGAYLRFVIAHDRRHLWQAQQVRHTPGFGLPLSASGQA